MTFNSANGRFEGLGELPMYVTFHRQITDNDLPKRLWELYVLGFAEDRERAPYREMLFHSEFDHIVSSGQGRVYVVWDEGTPIGLGLLTCDLDENEWTNGEFFKARYPGDRKTYYVAGTVTHPDYRDSDAMTMLVKCYSDLSANENAVIVFDFCETDRPGAADTRARVIQRLSSSVVDSEMEQIGVQKFYAISAVGEKKTELEFLVDGDADVIDLRERRPDIVEELEEIERRVITE